MTTLDIPGIGELRLALDIDLMLLEPSDAYALAERLEGIATFLRTVNAVTADIIEPDTAPAEPATDTEPRTAPKKTTPRKKASTKKPSGIHECDVCGRTFASPSGVSIHKARMHDTTPGGRSTGSNIEEVESPYRKEPAAVPDSRGFGSDLGPISKTSTDRARDRALV